ncbi:MAG: glycosyltransferase family protein [Sedimentisphaerales bacterium]|nr:glycosyltransferase family protein [Sedimentisphaerales bacterium]
MGMDSGTDRYEQALKLAETGRHEKALSLLEEHLRENPSDAQGWNDAGAILFCLRRVEDAIKYFEKAIKLSGPQAAGEIYWNLCEAYLDGGYPGMAARLFDQMESLKILSPDTLNRTADVFLKEENLGGALEMLLYSLRLAPEQEVLEPMIEVIRSKRSNVAIFAVKQTKTTQRLYDFMDKRFQTKLNVGKSMDEISTILEWSHISWFEGCDELLSAISRRNKICRTVVRLDARDVYDAPIEEVNWDNIDVVIINGGLLEKQTLLSRMEDLEKRTRVITTFEGVDLSRVRFQSRCRGKKLVWMGDLDAQSNPILLLQCMQKLNYIDKDYRLYIAGRCVDTGMEQYLRYMVDKLNLSSAVVFEPEVKNLNQYLLDKHFIVSTAIDLSGLSSVLTAMACGLKPVVHDFPGAEQWIDSSYLFGISEQFCNLVLSDDYRPQHYRQIVEQQYRLRHWTRPINDVLYKLEKNPVAKTTMPTFVPMQSQVFPVQTEASCQSHKGQTPYVPAAISEPRTIPITPMNTANMDIPVRSDSVRIGPSPSEEISPPVSSSEKPGNKSYSEMGRQRITERMAREALEATRALEELARRDNKIPGDNQWQDNSVSPESWSSSGFSSIDAMTQEDRVQKMAGEFSGIPSPVIEPVENISIVGEPHVPFTK